ncbi:MAG: REP-associated tyrosine transposase [Opitutaceae bacterium]
MSLPSRKQLPHDIPDWVQDGAPYFITFNCEPRKVNQLANPETFRSIQNAAAHYTAQNLWHLQIMMVMPDHIHLLCSLNTRTKSIKTIIGGWKRYLAKANAIKWQSNFFEHRIRHEDELSEKFAYIKNNPVRAKLCDSATDWPYSISNC